MSNEWNWLLPFPKDSNYDNQQHKAAYQVATPDGELVTRVDYHQLHFGTSGLFTPSGDPEFGITDHDTFEFRALLKAELHRFKGISLQDQIDTRTASGGTGLPMLADFREYWTSVQIDFVAAEDEPRNRLGKGSVQRAGWFAWLQEGMAEPSEYLSLPGQFSQPKAGRARGLWLVLEPSVSAVLRFTRLRYNNTATSVYLGIFRFPTIESFYTNDPGVT